MDQKWSGKTLGLIGTKQTINSGIYSKKAEALGKDIHIKSLATPLLAPMIEEGFFNHTISEQIIKEYLLQPVLQNIDGLILGCTHYPYLIPSISRIVTNDIKIIDSGFAVARQTKNILHKLNIAQTKEKSNTTHKFYSNKDSNVLTRLLNNDHLEILSKEF